MTIGHGGVATAADSALVPRLIATAGSPLATASSALRDSVTAAIHVGMRPQDRLALEGIRSGGWLVLVDEAAEDIPTAHATEVRLGSGLSEPTGG